MNPLDTEERGASVLQVLPNSNANGINASQLKGACILPLKDALDIHLVGGKAINLAKMMQAQLPVPDGFVITTVAYAQSINGKIGPKLYEQINEAMQSMKGKMVAARSSATAEDMPGASMAGQYDTYLNLSSVNDVVDAIEKCWGSIQSPRTKAYLKEHNIDPEQVSMAVVVQELVLADVAGVLFTVDPKNGSREHILLEATWGLGETLVSGITQPDIIRVRTQQEEVESYEVATKKLSLVPGSKDPQPVTKEQQDKACLDYEKIMELRKLGLLAASHFQSPQDIEWAIEKGELYLLQARPITTLSETDCFNDLLKQTKKDLEDNLQKNRGPWVRHNLGETLPHPTPLTWKIVSHFMSGAGGFGKMYKDLGFQPSPVLSNESFLEKVAGEIYMDCSLMTEMFSENYPFSYDIDLLRKDPDAAQNPPTIPQGGMKEMAKASKLAASAAERIDKLALDLDSRFEQEFITQVIAWSEEQESYPIYDITSDELKSTWHEQVEKVMGEFGASAFLPSMVEAVVVEKLKLFLEEHCWDDEPSELISHFAISLNPDCTMTANIELEQISKGHNTVSEWCHKHGFRSPAEFELANPRWHERCEDIEKMAQQMSGGNDLHSIHENKVKKAKECLAELKAKLSPALAAKLQSHVDLVQRYIRFREDGKYYLMRAYSVLRRTALECGRRLKIGSDIFFLEPDEIFESLQRGFIPKDKIAKRKLTYQVEKRVQLPHVIDKSNLQTLGSAPPTTGGSSIKVHSVSSGCASAQVVIVLAPDDKSEIPKGSILVCPSTDPSWTPLFVNAAGLILERGGSLSHGAVVAREMGLPAVILDRATELLNEGEVITIDAGAGWVYRGKENITQELSQNTNIPRKLIPPCPSTLEAKANMSGLIAALTWGIFLAAVYLLPAPILHDPTMTFLDIILWPIMNAFGMVGAVALIATFFGLTPIIAQRFLTDNMRLFEAKRRSAQLSKECKDLPKISPRRKRMEELSRPTTLRILKAAMVPLAFLLGPMMMIFMWFPGRVDPLSWNANPGRMVSIVAEVDGEWTEDISLSLLSPLSLDSSTPSAQKLPPIRKELEDLRREWQNASGMDNLPWEVQAAGDHARQVMLNSLNAYLKNGISPQKITWLIDIPESADGNHHVTLNMAENKSASFQLAFGKSVPPPEATIPLHHPALKLITVNYPRALQKESFWTPLVSLGGSEYDFGWLGVYLLAYLPIMFIGKFILKVP
ncbi:MAG: hypothetical protein HQL32_04690 [Planctomycetes bacterium]|nr:hypothetical protein [Planctomycetota bacterium]